jgi:hypothetical protein
MFQQIQEGAFHANLTRIAACPSPSLRACPCLPDWYSFQLSTSMSHFISQSTSLLTFELKLSSLLWPMELLCVAPDGPIWHQHQLDSS